jgi:hypothetical protein
MSSQDRSISSEGRSGGCLELARVLHYALREHTALARGEYRRGKRMTHTMLRGVDILPMVCVALQRVPVTRGNPPVVSDIPTTLEVKVVLQRTCYDCHPWSTRRERTALWPQILCLLS